MTSRAPVVFSISPRPAACNSISATRGTAVSPSSSRRSSATSAARAAGGVPRGRRSTRGADAESSIELSLHDAYTGGKRTLNLQTHVTCPRCHGTGNERGKLCHECHGNGFITQTKSLEVTIPPGVRDGQRIRLAGQGEAGLGGGQSGDLYLVVHIGPDRAFTRTGDDLYVEQPTSIYTLVLGGEVTVQTMSGKITLKVPAHSQNGRKLRVAGKGMPKLARRRTRRSST